VTAVARAGDASPLGGAFLSFAPPAGNRPGAVAVAADLAGASSTSVIFVDDPQ
jgi:hypothetical protein